MGEEAMVELIVRLEKALHAEARAFVVVSIDRDSKSPLSATGPFPQAELALVEAGRQEAEWRREADLGEEDAIHYVVVPLWEPTPTARTPQDEEWWK